MVTKTLGRWLSFVLAFTLLSTDLWGKKPKKGVPQEKALVTISVYNDAAVSDDVLSRGEEEASRVFLQAGIEMKWLNCGVRAADEKESKPCGEAVYPEHLHLRIVRKAIGVEEDTLGISFLAADGIGCYADLFYEPMEELHKTNKTNVANLLGHVAAHEIGHLLLGTNSHAVSGIMHAHWTATELEGGEGERMIFLEKESERMKKRLLRATQVSKGSVNTGAMVRPEWAITRESQLISERN